MGQGRVAETELMPRLGGDYTEQGCSKWKTGKGFSKPNFERVLKSRQVRRVRRVIWCKVPQPWITS